MSKHKSLTAKIIDPNTAVLQVCLMIGHSTVSFGHEYLRLPHVCLRKSCIIVLTRHPCSVDRRMCRIANGYMLKLAYRFNYSGGTLDALH